jgi:hypothetical protein
VGHVLGGTRLQRSGFLVSEIRQQRRTRVLRASCQDAPIVIERIPTPTKETVEELNTRLPIAVRDPIPTKETLAVRWRNATVERTPIPIKSTDPVFTSPPAVDGGSSQPYRYGPYMRPKPRLYSLFTAFGLAASRE